MSDFFVDIYLYYYFARKKIAGINFLRSRPDPVFIKSSKPQHGTMVLIFDGSSEYGAHICNKSGISIC